MLICGVLLIQCVMSHLSGYESFMPLENWESQHLLLDLVDFEVLDLTLKQYWDYFGTSVSQCFPETGPG